MDVYSWTWLGLGAAFAATEVTAILRKDWAGTFTENVQRLFGTKSLKGKLIFSAVWCGFAIWFLGHVDGLWP